MKRIISTSVAPAAVGPYSQGVEASGATLYVSGQLPIDPADGTMPDTVEQQTEQALRNVEAILREAGYSLSDVVKSVVLLHAQLLAQGLKFTGSAALTGQAVAVVNGKQHFQGHSPGFLHLGET